MPGRVVKFEQDKPSGIEGKNARLGSEQLLELRELAALVHVLFEKYCETPDLREQLQLVELTGRVVRKSKPIVRKYVAACHAAQLWEHIRAQRRGNAN